MWNSRNGSNSIEFNGQSFKPSWSISGRFARLYGIPESNRKWEPLWRGVRGRKYKNRKWASWNYVGLKFWKRFRQRRAQYNPAEGSIKVWDGATQKSHLIKQNCERYNRNFFWRIQIHNQLEACLSCNWSLKVYRYGANHPKQQCFLSLTEYLKMPAYRIVMNNMCFSKGYSFFTLLLFLCFLLYFCQI